MVRRRSDVGCRITVFVGVIEGGAARSAALA